MSSGKAFWLSEISIALVDSLGSLPQKLFCVIRVLYSATKYKSELTTIQDANDFPIYKIKLFLFFMHF